MKELVFLLFVTLVPFWGTVLGAGTVLFVRRPHGERGRALFLGFAAGVMLAASVWSLLLPALERGGVLAAGTGFLSGGLFFLLAEGLVREVPDSTRSLIFAVTLHNLPEGMAVGVVAAEALVTGERGDLLGAAVLALGIAIQNFPEGAVISLPLRGQGQSRKRAFSAGALSGVVEPLGAAAALIFTSRVLPLLPFFLAFAAGAMIHVAARELIPEIAQGKGARGGVLALFFGFTLMMSLDVLLG